MVEYASDVEQQTPHTTTTQETVALYMKNQLQFFNFTSSDVVCVVNTGLHDQKLCTGKSNEYCRIIYGENVRFYLRQLQISCGSIVWIATTPVRGDRRQMQKNESILVWNKDVCDILSGFESTYFIDVWNEALGEIHVDNVHFRSSYYEALGSLFTNLM